MPCEHGEVYKCVTCEETWVPGQLTRTLRSVNIEELVTCSWPGDDHPTLYLCSKDCYKIAKAENINIIVRDSNGNDDHVYDEYRVNDFSWRIGRAGTMVDRGETFVSGCVRCGYVYKGEMKQI